jgi:hypothetical protein
MKKFLSLHLKTLDQTLWHSGKYFGFIFWRSWIQISSQRSAILRSFAVFFSPTRQISGYYVQSEVLTAVTMKNTIFWDMIPCSLVFIKGIPKDGDNTFFHNVWKHIPDYMASYPRRQWSSMPRKYFKISHDHFIPHSFQFIIHQSSYHLMLHNLTLKQCYLINHETFKLPTNPSHRFIHLLHKWKWTILSSLSDSCL